MVRVRVLDTLPAEFAALILTVYCPADDGVPVIFPAFEHESPEGSPVALNVIGVVPVAFIAVEAVKLFPLSKRQGDLFMARQKNSAHKNNRDAPTLRSNPCTNITTQNL